MRTQFICGIVVALISYGIPVYAAEIHEAAQAGNLQLLETLLSANPELTSSLDNRQCSPLHFAADGGSVDAVAMLLDLGADIAALDIDGDTPLHWAAMAGNPYVVAALLEHGSDVNAANYALQTPLHYAVMSADQPTLKALIDGGADLAAQDDEGETILGYVAYRSQAELVPWLVEQGADLEQVNHYGRTPLLLVARETGDTDTARALLSCGADVNARDTSSSSSLDLAAWRGFGDLVNLLLDHGAEYDLEREAPILASMAALVGASWTGTKASPAVCSSCSNGWPSWRI